MTPPRPDLVTRLIPRALLAIWQCNAALAILRALEHEPANANIHLTIGAIALFLWVLHA